jgi:phosphatidylserine synthase
MKYLSPFRLASYFLVLFFAGHTAGGMLGPKSHGPDADAVFASMKAVHFTFKGSTTSWYGVWFAFGLLVSVFLLFSAIAAWQLDKVNPTNWPSVSVIAWALVASHACNAVLSWTYFFAAPGIFATIVTILLAAGAWLKQRAR